MELIAIRAKDVKDAEELLPKINVYGEAVVICIIVYPPELLSIAESAPSFRALRLRNGRREKIRRG